MHTFSIKTKRTRSNIPHTTFPQTPYILHISTKIKTFLFIILYHTASVIGSLTIAFLTMSVFLAQNKSNTNLLRPGLHDPTDDHDDMLSTWSHRAWVATGCTTVLISLAKSIMGAANSHIWLEPILAGLFGYVMADLLTGVYHWVIDNYGSASTPFFGDQIKAFQGHHEIPLAITRRQFANNLHALARAATIIMLPIDLAFDDPVIHGFFGVCFGCLVLSQQFHAWAHCPKSRLPQLVVALQGHGLLVSRLQHAAHHRPPYNKNYCIVSGVWNEFLDKHKVFEKLEMVLFSKLGVRPRSWDIGPN